MADQSRIPSLPDVAAINGAEFRIHPADLREVRELFRFVWPDNAPREVFKGVRLIADVSAPMLPRVPL